MEKTENVYGEVRERNKKDTNEWGEESKREKERMDVFTTTKVLSKYLFVIMIIFPYSSSYPCTLILCLEYISTYIHTYTHKMHKFMQFGGIDQATNIQNNGIINSLWKWRPILNTSLYSYVAIALDFLHFFRFCSHIHTCIHFLLHCKGFITPYFI